MLKFNFWKAIRPLAKEFKQDKYGVVHIQASEKFEMVDKWGFAHAKDRFFQMDLLRHRAAGRLSEIFGCATLEVDINQRLFDFAELAEIIFLQLSLEERKILERYSQGVNRWIDIRGLTFEHLVLRYPITRWQPRDSILIMLYFFQLLALDVEGKLTQKIMQQVLPKSVVEFFLPRSDEFDRVVADDALIPIADLKHLMQECEGSSVDPLIIEKISVPLGSNCWTLPGNKTKHGYPILANDMHLPLSVPNIWHRIVFQYNKHRVMGIAIPGIPIIISGSNRYLSWGITNLPGNVAEIILLDDGDKRFAIKNKEELIKIRGHETKSVMFATTELGPVLRERVCEKTAILQWSALWPETADMGMIGLHEAETIVEAVAIAHRGGTPPLNIHFAHRDGNTAQTIIGRIPLCNKGVLQRNNFLRNEEILLKFSTEHPLITTNNPPLIQDGEQDPGWNYSAGYRKKRIAECLNEKNDWCEKDILSLQQDCEGGFYVYYKQLIVSLLTAKKRKLFNFHLEPELYKAVELWDGYCQPNSRGIAILDAYRITLLRSILPYFLRPCYFKDKNFKYVWRNSEPVLRKLIQARPDQIVPESYLFNNWEDYLLQKLIDCCEALKTKHKKPLFDILWQDVMSVELRHPLGHNILGWLLNLKSFAPSGGGECIASFGSCNGCTDRMVVSPGREEKGLFQMLGGQSGNPFSRHYKDCHAKWLENKPIPFYINLED
jgi:penicillin amidase